MKNLFFVTVVTVLFSITAAKAQVNPTELPQDCGPLLEKMFPGYSASYILENSKVVEIEKTVKEPYVTTAVGPDGKSVIVSAAPLVGHKVFMFKKTKKYFYNQSTKNFLLTQELLGSTTAQQQTNAGRPTTSSQGSKATPAEKAQKTAMIFGVLKEVGGAVLNRMDRRGAPIGGGADLGFGNGMVIQNTNTGMVF